MRSGLTDIQNNTRCPQVNGEPIEAIGVRKNFGRHVIVLAAHTLGLHEPPDCPACGVGDGAGFAGIVVGDAQAHTHVYDHALVAVDEDILQ